MNRIKIYAASAVFLLLTAVKLCLPQQAQSIRKGTLELVGHNDDYRQMVQTLGRNLSESRIGNELLLVFRGDEEQNAEQLVPVISEPEEAADSQSTAEIVETDTVLQTMQTEEPELLPESVDIEEEQPEAVSVFLAEQAEFEGHAIPANVRTDMPQLPFEYCCPVSGYDSSGFGYRVHPLQGEVKFHYGTDFAANSGDEILAFADGYVYAAGTGEGYGKYYIITHEGGYSTIYAHMSEFLVSEGDMVKRGQPIGEVGATGNATGPHLHFELLCNDVYVNPEYYL